MNTRPRIADEFLYIKTGQMLSHLTGWAWGPAWSMPNGRHGHWAIHDAAGTAVMCEVVEDAPLVEAIKFSKELDGVRDREAIEERNAYLRRFIEVEATCAADNAAVRAEHEPVRVPKRRNVLARAVEAQLEDILRTA